MQLFSKAKIMGPQRQVITLEVSTFLLFDKSMTSGVSLVTGWYILVNETRAKKIRSMLMVITVQVYLHRQSNNPLGG